MPDDFSGHETGLSSPARGGSAISPSDGGSLPQATRAIYVGQTGNLAVRLVSGEVVTLSNVQAGMIYPLRVEQVLASGTTATGLVGLR